MLIISNGAYKSGSTWLFFILKNLTGYGSPPSEFLNPMWKNPSIPPDKLKKFLESRLYKTNDYLVKQHFSGHLLETFLPYMDGNILFFNIKRDIRDVIVSSYYHVRRERNGFNRSFNFYYWSAGRNLHEGIRKYHLDFETLIDEQYRYIVSYENFVDDFDSELLKLSEALGIMPDQKKIEDIRQKTSFAKTKEYYEKTTGKSNKDFFRKGLVGDYQNHYTSLMYRDYAEKESIVKLKIVGSIFLLPELIFKVGRRFRSTE